MSDTTPDGKPVPPGFYWNSTSQSLVYHGSDGYCGRHPDDPSVLFGKAIQAAYEAQRHFYLPERAAAFGFFDWEYTAGPGYPRVWMAIERAPAGPAVEALWRRGNGLLKTLVPVCALAIVDTRRGRATLHHQQDHEVVNGYCERFVRGDWCVIRPKLDTGAA